MSTTQSNSQNSPFTNGGTASFRGLGKFNLAKPNLTDENLDSGDRTAVIAGLPGKSDASTSNAGSKGPNIGRAKPNADDVKPRKTYANPVAPAVVTNANQNSDEKTKDDQSQYDDYRPQVKIDKTKKAIELEKFQQDLDYCLLPISCDLETETLAPHLRQKEVDSKNKLKITSSAVFGQSGSGLSMLLAKRAYENYLVGRPTILLTDRRHLLPKMAQTIVDFAEPERREKLRDTIQVIGGGAKKVDLTRIDPEKKIYIVSAELLSNYLKANESYRAIGTPTMTMGVNTWRSTTNFKDHLRLSDIFPLKRIREILIDDVNLYMGKTDEGRSKLLTTLLQETATNPEVNPTHIMGTSSKPYDVVVEEGTGNLHECLQLEKLFPKIHETPSARELIEEAKYYKRPRIKNVVLDEQSHKDLFQQKTVGDAKKAKERLLDSSEHSINAQIVEQYLAEAKTHPNQKWHIVADTADHADHLCALFNIKAQGANAKAMTSQTTGYFGTIQNPQSEGDKEDKPKASLKLNDVNQTELRKVSTINVQDITDSYEYGDTNVIIDLNQRSCYRSCKTDKVVVLKRSDSENNTKYYLGEAVKDRENPEKDTIEYLFLSPRTADEFREFTLGKRLDSNAVHKGKADDTKASEVLQPTLTDTDLQIEEDKITRVNKAWYDRGLSTIIKKRYGDIDLEEALNQLSQDFSKHLTSSPSQDELKDIIAGLKRDPELFQQFVEFAGVKGQTRFLNYQEVASYAPELTGVQDETAAKRILDRAFEEMFLLTDTPIVVHEAWLNRLDAALGIDSTGSDIYDRYETRNKYFAKLLSRKFGLEAFENRSFVHKMLRVFMGAEIDFKPFGLLVNTFASDTPQAGAKGFSFEDIRAEFKDLVGEYRAVPFSLLQRKIVLKYPDGPPKDQSISDFFNQQLYDDSITDFGSLVKSARTNSIGTQETLIDDSVEAEIKDFLEKLYDYKVNQDFPQDSSVRPGPDDFKNQVDQKALNSLSTITREILFNQLIAKIWGQGRATRISNDDFVINMSADTLDVSTRNTSELENFIDLTKVNSKWLSSFDTSDDKKYFQVDLKKRLAFKIGNFISQRDGTDPNVRDAANNEAQRGDEYFILGARKSRMNMIDAQINPETDISLSEAQQRQVNVLIGAVDPSQLSLDDKELLRDFARYDGKALNVLIPQFPALLGIKNSLEAIIVVLDSLKKVTNRDEKWISNFGREQQRVELISDFIFEDPSKVGWLYDSALLKNKLEILSGNYSNVAAADIKAAQNLNREFIDFANNNGLNLKTEDLVLNFRKQIGLRTKKELFSVMRQPGFINWDKSAQDSPNKWQNHNSFNLERLMLGLAVKLGLEISEFYALADMRDPVNFYSSPLREITDYFSEKLEFDSKSFAQIEDEFKALLEKNRYSIMARNLLAQIGSKDYIFPVAEFIVPKGEDISPRLVLNIEGNTISCDEQHLNLNYREGAKRFQEVKWLKAKDYQGFEFNDQEWKLTQSSAELDILSGNLFRVGRALTEATVGDSRAKLDKNWLARLNMAKDPQQRSIPDYQKLIIVVDSFIRHLVIDEGQTQYKDDVNEFKRLIQICVGDERAFKNNPESQDLFRKFVGFINNPPDCVGKYRKGVREFSTGPINLSDVIKESPKLTGVRSFEELKATINFNFKSYEDFQKEISNPVPNAEAKQSLDVLSRFTYTSVDKLLSFEEINDELQNYQDGMKQLTSSTLFDYDGFNNNADCKKKLLGAILIKQLFLQANDLTYKGWDQRFRHPIDEDFLVDLTFINNKLQLDFMRQKNGLAYKLVVHETLDFDSNTKTWSKILADASQLKARFALMKLFGKAEGAKVILSNTSDELVQAYDAILSKKHERDYLFFKVTNLMVDFFADQDPEFFNREDPVVEPELFTKMASLLGNERYADRDLLNKFIDFAEARHSGFAALRNDPKFKEVFFEIKGQKTEKFLNFLKENINDKKLMEIVQIKKTGDEILLTLLEKASKSPLNVPSLDELLSDLKLDSDVKSHLKPGFELLASYITPEMHGFKDQSSLIKLVSDAPDSMPVAYQNKYNSLRVLKEIFPDFNFGFENTHLNNNMVPLEIIDEKTGEKNKEYELAIEFDGKSLIFWKLLNEDRVASRDIKVDFDKQSGTWVFDKGASIRPELSSTEAIKLLRSSYPDGITDPKELPKIAAEHGIDMDLLKPLINIKAKYSNLIDIMTKTISEHGEELKISSETQESTRKLLQSVFKGENLQILENKLLAEHIWDLDPLNLKVASPESNLEINFNQDVELLVKAPVFSGKKDLAFSFKKDLVTGLYIPYQKDKASNKGSAEVPLLNQILQSGSGSQPTSKQARVLTINSDQVSIFSQLIDSDFVVQEQKRKADSVMAGRNYDERVEAVLSYISIISGKSIKQLLDQEAPRDDVISKYTSGLEKLMATLIPSNINLQGQLRTLFTDQTSKNDIARKLQVDHLLKNIWADSVDSYSFFVTKEATFSTQDGQYKDLKLKMVFKPNQVRFDLIDVNDDIKEAFVLNYDKELASWGKVSRHEVN